MDLSQLLEQAKNKLAIIQSQDVESKVAEVFEKAREEIRQSVIADIQKDIEKQQIIVNYLTEQVQAEYALRMANDGNSQI